MRTVFLDIETTGLHARQDEIVEVGILDDAGAVLVDSLVKPALHIAWPEAERIHGISPARVADAPALSELRPRIAAAVAGARVVCFNSTFELDFLPNELEAAAEVRCVMRAWAGDDGRWPKLTAAAAAIRFRWPGPAHRAIHDCAATRAIWRYLTDPEERARIEAERQEEDDDNQAGLALRFLERDAADARREFEIEAEQALFVRVGLRLSQRLSEADSDALVRVFTGCSRTVWETWQRYLDLPAYRHRSEIPRHLVARSGLRGRSPWVLERLSPAAIYVSPSGLQALPLFDPAAADALERVSPPRYESFAAVPTHLVTRTRYRQIRGADPLQLKLKPVAEVRLLSRRGRVYTPLYPLDPLDLATADPDAATAL